MSGSHFYTAIADEAAHILATWPNVFSLDGPTYAVNPGPVPCSTPVYRFYNLMNGSHFYTASADRGEPCDRYLAARSIATRARRSGSDNEA